MPGDWQYPAHPHYLNIGEDSLLETSLRLRVGERKPMDPIEIAEKSVIHGATFLCTERNFKSRRHLL
ncbi:hypothetical protein BDW67DRAFT_156246 [Aspergillus spinulosporus]